MNKDTKKITQTLYKCLAVHIRSSDIPLIESAIDSAYNEGYKRGILKLWRKK